MKDRATSISGDLNSSGQTSVSENYKGERFVSPENLPSEPYNDSEEDDDYHNSDESDVLNDSEVSETDFEPQDPEKPESPLLILFKILFNPVEGWKSLRRSGNSPDRIQSECFYPLLAILAASNFAQLFYSTTTGISSILIEAVVVFVSFFAGYFCIILLLGIFLPKRARIRFENDFGKTFVMMSLSTLCLFFIMINLFPMMWSLLIFLPLWTIYVVCRGVRFFRFPDDCKLRSTFILCVFIIGVPSVIDWIIKEITTK